MSWILQVKFGCLLKREPSFPPEVIHLVTVIAHWKSLACIMQEARLGGHHGPFHQGDLRCSERVPTDNLRDSPQNNLTRCTWTSSGAGVHIWPLPQPLLFSEQEALKLFPTTTPTSKNSHRNDNGSRKEWMLSAAKWPFKAFQPMCSICDSFKLASQMNAQAETDLTKGLKG